MKPTVAHSFTIPLEGYGLSSAGYFFWRSPIIPAIIQGLTLPSLFIHMSGCLCWLPSRTLAIFQETSLDVAWKQLSSRRHVSPLRPRLRNHDMSLLPYCVGPSKSQGSLQIQNMKKSNISHIAKVLVSKELWFTGATSIIRVHMLCLLGNSILHSIHPSPFSININVGCHFHD